MTDVNIAVKASVGSDGFVTCDVACDGQQATLTFTGTAVLIAIPEAAQAAG
ncbi:MAG: hypothetical protein JWM19_991 [Actinomycetia bacterium]|nr:hypothetical protein [Actinomycetes bacterium]